MTETLLRLLTDTIVMSKNRFRWSQADANEDNALNRTEFLAYRHPELSEPTLYRMADDLITNLDEDKDGMLTVKEFARIPKVSACRLTSQLLIRIAGEFMIQP